MTKGEFITQNKNTIKRAVELGITPPHIMRMYDIYCDFISMKINKGEKMMAYESLAIKHGVKIEYVTNAIRYMRETI